MAGAEKSRRDLFSASVALGTEAAVLCVWQFISPGSSNPEHSVRERVSGVLGVRQEAYLGVTITVVSPPALPGSPCAPSAPDEPVAPVSPVAPV